MELIILGIIMKITKRKKKIHSKDYFLCIILGYEISNYRYIIHNISWFSMPALFKKKKNYFRVFKTSNFVIIHVYRCFYTVRLNTHIPT